MSTQITSLKQLEAARLQRKAVHCPKEFSFQKPMPAAWAINLNGAVLLRMFQSGMFIYSKSAAKTESL